MGKIVILLYEEGKIVDKIRKKQLEEKIAKSKEIVREAFSKFNNESLDITWTGGKDSTLTLWIIRKVCGKDSIAVPKVMTIDEGDSFPQIQAFLKKIFPTVEAGPGVVYKSRCNRCSRRKTWS